MKLKGFCTAKKTINKMKRQPSEWEKIFANEATDTGLISKIYKQLMQLNIKQNNPIQKWAEDHISPKKIHKLPDIHERMLNITNAREMQIETTMRYHLTPVRMAVIKNQRKTIIEKHLVSNSHRTFQIYSFYEKIY